MLEVFGNVSERALKEIFNSTGGRKWIGGWSEKDGWMSSASLSEWKGAKVNESGQVIELNLYYNNLQGNIPLCLAVLSKLTKLNLSWNKLAGEIPRELGELSSLEELRLDNNTLTGVIPRELGELSSLEELYLEMNNLAGNTCTQASSLTRILL